MSRKRIFTTPLAAAALFCTVTVLQASSFSISISLDENGHGNFSNTNGFNAALVSSQINDPGPGGLSNVLNYGLISPPGLIAGDVLLLDAGGVSDVIRFDPTTNSGSVFFYSLPGGGSLADIGLPTATEANNLSLSETIAETVGYTPIAGQPGFVTGSGGPVTYTFTSEETPEPSTALLLLTGLTVTAASLHRNRLRITRNS